MEAPPLIFYFGILYFDKTIKLTVTQDIVPMKNNFGPAWQKIVNLLVFIIIYLNLHNFTK